MKMYEEHEMCGEVDSGSLYKIGMFAAMNRVTVKALRFYEEQAGCICAFPEYCFTNYLEPSYKEEDILVELCESVTECKDDIGELHFKMIPKLQVASIFHKGSYNTLDASYQSVLRYVEDNGYEIVGAIRESYIDGVWNKEDESEWLTEIQVPIKKLPVKNCLPGKKMNVRSVLI